ncbi:MAG TPA: methylated-DNA--[protein]-cysteine S-methyltransferase [Gemmatimonadaceae bacterium]|nr:methylated-DNA--[protein]-cysteine S-methyltransferase [Gemmatimonadaceae bacterium]
MTTSLAARSHTRRAKSAAEPARRAGTDVLRVAIVRSPIGLVLVARSAAGLAAVLLGDDRAVLRRELRARFPLGKFAGADPALDSLAAKIVAYIDHPGPALDEPLDARGTPFQQEVWRALRAIPAGSTSTYGDIAAQLGRPGCARAVGTACAVNPIAIVIPCHRVVARDGALTGYRWGVERKRALLEREAAVRAAR